MPQNLPTCSPQSLGEAITSLRTEKNLSQAALADRAEVHRNYLAGLERGGRNPTLAVLVRLSGALDVPLSEIVGLAEQYAASASS